MDDKFLAHSGENNYFVMVLCCFFLMNPNSNALLIEAIIDLLGRIVSIRLI